MFISRPGGCYSFGLFCWSFIFDRSSIRTCALTKVCLSLHHQITINNSTMKNQILAALNAEYAKLVAYDGTEEFKFQICIAPAVKACGYLLKETYEGKMVFTEEMFEKFCDDKEEGKKPNILEYGQRLVDIFA